MYRTLVILAAAAMLVSLILPWVNLPGVQFIVPWEMLKPLWDQFEWDMPREAMIFAASFAAAAVIVLLAAIGAAPRLLTLIVGLYPFVLAFLAWGQMRDEAAALGVPVPDELDPTAIWDQLSPFLGFGIYAYFGGAVVLVLMGLVGGGRRR